MKNVWQKYKWKNILYFELIINPNVDIIGIKAYMWEKYEFETIFNSNDVMNFKDLIGKVLRSIEREYSMGVNDYFGPRLTHRPHAAPKYGPGKSNYEVNYYRQTYYHPEKVAYIKKTGKTGQE